jgi:predicted Ser/Thr protein kinase
MSSITESPRIISMEVSMSGRCDNFFRIEANRTFKYITAKAKTLDAEEIEDMCIDLQQVLPPLPWHEHTWNSASISRDSSSQLVAKLSFEKLPEVKTIWHERIVDCLNVERTGRLTPLTQECKLSTDHDTSMIAKMARFGWEVQYIEAETQMYQKLKGKDITPNFLGHIHEASRVMGFLLEKIPDGRNAETADLKLCEAALQTFHSLGYVHGDCNKFNFIIRPDNSVVLIDFDKSKPCDDPEVLQKEMDSLKWQLAESSGRGGGYMAWDEEEDG